MTTPPHWDAIIVAGGRASRLGGIDKTALVYEGRSLLQLALDAVRLAEHVSVVGSASLVSSARIRQTEESPRWGGPAAAIVAGLGNLRDSDSEFTAVVAADQPQVGEALGVLLNTLSTEYGDDGLVALDSGGQRQPLLAVYRTSSLRTATSRLPLDGLSVRRLVETLALRFVPLPGELCSDIDTPADAARFGIRIPQPHPAMVTG